MEATMNAQVSVKPQGFNTVLSCPDLRAMEASMNYTPVSLQPQGIKPSLSCPDLRAMEVSMNDTPVSLQPQGVAEDVDLDFVDSDTNIDEGLYAALANIGSPIGERSESEIVEVKESIPLYDLQHGEVGQSEITFTSPDVENAGDSLNATAEDETSPVEQVRLTVSNTDDPTLPVLTFRMWFLGLTLCIVMSSINQYCSYRTKPLVITQILVQVISLPAGRFLAWVLPRRTFRLPGFGDREFSLNPGPFNNKERALISILTNAGCGFGEGSTVAIGAINVIKAFYRRRISFMTSWIFVISNQMLGYGMAGLLRKYVVEPAHMWWPSTLVQVSLFRALSEREQNRVSRLRFFFKALLCSFLWFTISSYLFTTIQTISWICWAFPDSVTAQQLGSGVEGLGIGAFTLDWSVIVSFPLSPLAFPFATIVNIFIGYILIVYIVNPISYWGLNLYNAKAFPITSLKIFTSAGGPYDIKTLINDKFEFDIDAYVKHGRIHLSTSTALSFAFSFAAFSAILTHVGFFYGKEVYERFRATYRERKDIHARLMSNYRDIPEWWFYSLLIISLFVSFILCTFMNDVVQLQWWGLLLACFMAFIFTLPVSIITATTNVYPKLNVITEYVIGLLQPGKQIANICFRVYGYSSLAQAVSFLGDFKLGHYMKIPPRSVFLVQLVGTVVAGTVNLVVAWWVLGRIENICQIDRLPHDSPWTCPADQSLFNTSILFGLVGPQRIFGSLGNYGALNWFFLIGALGPIMVWILYKLFPNYSWIKQINMPVILVAISSMPSVMTLNCTTWVVVGSVFSFFVFRYRKRWWARYNYVLSAALDAGVAIMGVVLYVLLQSLGNPKVDWWGTKGEHCKLASCPTAEGVEIKGCPIV